MLFDSEGICLRKSIDDRHSNCYKKYMSPKQIVAIRKALGITQEELASRIAANRVSVRVGKQDVISQREPT